MDEQKIEEFKQDFALLLEAGFIAVKQLDETSATRIFQAAQSLSPLHTAPQVGIGYIALNKMEIKEASAIFEKVLQVEPENHLAEAFLAICYLLTKDKIKKGVKMISEIIQKSNEPTIKNLGVVALQWAKDLEKKAKSGPFFSQDPSAKT
jgi:Flp pilus assembly protein TadD